MEGLIPYLIHAMKKQKDHNSSYRSFFGGSSHSYHLLIDGGSVEGSSQRRSRSELQPPSMEFLEQRPGIEFIRSRSVNKGAVFNAASMTGGLYNNDSQPQQMMNKGFNNDSASRGREVLRKKIV